eukprot:m51a1_g12910 hypothetical protein (199) ;mRNA; r:1212-2216
MEVRVLSFPQFPHAPEKGAQPKTHEVLVKYSGVGITVVVSEGILTPTLCKAIAAELVDAGLVPVGPKYAVDLGLPPAVPSSYRDPAAAGVDAGGGVVWPQLRQEAELQSDFFTALAEAASADPLRPIYIDHALYNTPGAPVLPSWLDHDHPNWNSSLGAMVYRWASRAMLVGGSEMIAQFNHYETLVSTWLEFKTLCP